MTRISKGDYDSEGLYHNEVVMTSGTYGSVYTLPTKPILSIGLYVTGSGSWEFSIDSLDTLDAGSGVFVRWDGVATVNKAVTGFRMVRDSGTVSGMVTVKTFNP